MGQKQTILTLGIVLSINTLIFWTTKPYSNIGMNMWESGNVVLRRATVERAASVPRILCWVMCDPDDLEKRVRHVKNTWAAHCDVTLYMSSQRNDTFPTIGLAVPPGRSHIGIKSRAAWTFVYDHYLHEAEYFVKCDPDTFLVVHNLKAYLSRRDPHVAEMFGHRLKLTAGGGAGHKVLPRGGQRKVLMFNSGGPGQVLSREALRTMVEVAFRRPGKHCMSDGEGEDWKTAACLRGVGVRPVDTRDSQGRQTFMVYAPAIYVHGRFTTNYRAKDVDGAPWGYHRGCCSNRPIAFHYVSPEDQYVLYYMFYRIHGHDHRHTEPLFYNSTPHSEILSFENATTQI